MQSAVGHGVRPVSICLYVAIPEAQARRPHARPLPARLKSTVKHGFNSLRSRLSGRLVLEGHHYLAMAGLDDNSNRGDMAILMAIREQLTAAFAPRPVAFVEIGWGDLDDAALADVNRRCDLFVIGGGGYIFVNADGSLGGRFADLDQFARLTVPLYAYGIGLNRLMHEDVCDIAALPDVSRGKIAALAGFCRSISVRDADTQLLFQLHAGCSPAVIGDPVLFLHPGRYPRPAPGPRPVIGVNLAAHSWRAVAVLQPLLPRLIPLLKDQQDRADLVYLLHHDVDRPVYAHLRHQGVQVALADGSPEELLATYARIDFVINQMLHSCIFAANARTAFLNIAYDRKSIAFCQVMGVPQCAVPHDRANTALLAGMFGELFASRAGLAATLEQHKSSLHAAQLQFAGELADQARVRSAG